MSDMIRIQPTRDRRVAFARWAVAQRPKIRTVSAGAFAVPPRLFVQAPEDILIGSLVDGHRYVSPDEDAAAGRPAPAAPELLGVATPAGLTPPPPAPASEEREAVPGEPLPEAPGPAHGPDAAPPDHDDQEQDDPDSGAPGDRAPRAGAYGCDLCPREFASVRGRDTHRRQAHTEA